VAIPLSGLIKGVASNGPGELIVPLAKCSRPWRSGQYFLAIYKQSVPKPRL